MKLFITLLFMATAAIAQDSPYSPNTNGDSYHSGYAKSSESSMYDLRRDNWRDEVQIRRELSGNSNPSGVGSYQGKQLRTPDAPPKFHDRLDYGKRDAWKKSNNVEDELSCRALFSDVQRMQANLDGVSYQKLDKRRMDYHSYLSLITEGSQRLHGPLRNLRKYAAVGTTDQCNTEHQNAVVIYDDVWSKIKRHEEDFTSLRGVR